MAFLDFARLRALAVRFDIPGRVGDPAAPVDPAQIPCGREQVASGGSGVAWLTRGDEVLASVERRRRGYPDGTVTAIVRSRPLLLHAPLRGTVDVAWCLPEDDDGVEVRRMRTLGPRLPACPGWGPPVVIVAAGGAFERWRLEVGDHLSVRGG